MHPTIFTGSILNSPSNTYLISIGQDRILKGAVAKHVLETFGQEIQEILFTQNYFEKGDEYKDINTFTQYLKNEVKIYVNSFGKPRKEKKSIRERLIYVEETYSELIYFGEFNSVQARKEEFENRTEPEKELDKQRGYFGGLVGKIIGK